MRTLETTFAGLSLKNPVIVSSSSLTDNAEKNKQLCEAGAGAVVLKSLFEEQILQEVEGMEDFGKYALLILWAGANVFFFIYDRLVGQLTDIYVNWFRKRILKRK